ncbi:MAG: hypothetical protein M1816_007573 [Peltula sp. TS41687]|nr:MAG: hypothetical protein M1816_007573 [Peltula sp. TS41687]
MAICNTTLEETHIHEDPLLLALTFHQIGLILSATFALIATLVSSWLMLQHARHYSRPHEQKHIIRILLMVPIYSIVSFLSFEFYRHFIYFQVLRDCYEAVAIASFFTLLCHYIAPNLHDQKERFRLLTPRDWIWPLSWARRCCGGERGLWRTPRSGLTWFNIVWLGVFQYCLVRVLFTIVSVVTQALGRYCEASLNPVFAHIWVLAFEATSVTIAMYSLIQFYMQLKIQLSHHRPFLKLLSIKLVIFFSFWQTLMISLLTSTHVLRPSSKISYADIKVGFPSLLICIEMAIFSVLHLWAFTWREYETSKVAAFYEGVQAGYGGVMTAFKDAFNPWDIVKSVGRGFRWLFVGRRARLSDRSYGRHHTTGGGGGGAGGSTATGLGIITTVAGGANNTTTAAAGGSRRKNLDGEEDGEVLLGHAQPNPTSAMMRSSVYSQNGGIRIVSPEDDDDDDDDEEGRDLGDGNGNGGRGGGRDNPWQQQQQQQQQGVRPYDPSAYARYDQQQQQQQTQTQYGYDHGYGYGYDRR